MIDEKRINIAEVNDGKDYIIDEGKAAEYGVIFADPDESIWDDVTLPENLLKKARERLKSGVVLKKTIEVRAIDLNLTDEQMEALKVCSYVQVISKLHGIGAYYLLSRAEIHIDAPENTQYTLGAVKMALTDSSKAYQESIIRFVAEMGAAIPTDVGQLKNDVNYTTETEVKEIINTSGVAAPVICVETESEDSYILKIQTAAERFNTPNLKGRPGDPGMSAYESAVEAGFTGTEDEWFASLKGAQGDAGKSAYRIAVDNGYAGTEAEWVRSLKGEPGDAGKSAYEVALDSGFKGTEAEWLAFLKGMPGDEGRSAYDIALDNGFIGTEEEWLKSLKGAPGKDGIVKIEDIEGEEGAVLQFKNGQWQGTVLKGNGNDRIILDSPATVQENKDPGKLVDALVIKQVFQSVSEGKRLVALAITDKGVDTSATDTFEQMAGNISLIHGGGGTGEGVILKGLVNISMPAPEGKPQIANIIDGLDAGTTAVARSCEKVKITVKEG